MYAFYGALSLAFCYPLFAHPTGLGIFDWDQHLFYYAQVLKNVIEYGQLPFWSPWYCGGNVLWQNPQIALLSPVYPLTAIVPLALAMKINIVLHYWIGFVGMHLLLTRSIGWSFRPTVVYVASVFTLAGCHAMHLSVGHSTFLPAFYLPLQLFFFLRALDTGAVRYSLMAAAVFALMVYNGGLHIVPIAVIGIGSVALCAAAACRSWRPVILAILLCVAAAAYAAPKLLPVVTFVGGDRFWDTRNPIEHPDRMSITMMLHAYVDSHQSRDSRFYGQRHGWWEYGSYIGSAAALLIALSIGWALFSPRLPDNEDRPHWLARSFAFTSLAFLVLSAGEFGVYAPASLAARVPFFSRFHIASRYVIGFVLFGALTVAVAARPATERMLRTMTAKALTAGFCVAAVFQLIWVNSAQLQDVFSVAPLVAGFHFLRAPKQIAIDRDINVYGSNSPMLRSLMNDRAVFYCYEPLQLIRGTDSNHGLVFSDGQTKISSVVFTPNRVQFSALGGAEPSKIFLNQNFAAGWRSSGAEVRLDPGSGTPYVTLGANHAGKFSFAFSPPGLIPGLALSVIAAALSALVWRAALSL